MDGIVAMGKVKASNTVYIYMGYSYYLVNMNSRGIFKRNFTLSVATICMGVDLTLSRYFVFNCVRINKVPLYHSEDEEDKYYLAPLILHLL